MRCDLQPPCPLWASIVIPACLLPKGLEVRGWGEVGMLFGGRTLICNPQREPPKRSVPCHSHGTTANKARRWGLLGSLDWAFGLLVPGTRIKACDSNPLGAVHSSSFTGRPALGFRPVSQTYSQMFAQFYLLMKMRDTLVETLPHF